MTATSFDRSAVQQYFESLLGCRDISQWPSYQSALQGCVLSSTDVARLGPLLAQDAVAFYSKALQSFVQALSSFQRKEFSWPIVKMYYAVFFAMRSELLASSVVSVKCKKLFYAPNKFGSPFLAIQEKGSHQTYIKLRKVLPQSVITRDPLLDNEIEPGIDVFSWMRLNRERVNYHNRHFSDPEPDDILKKVYYDYVVTSRLTDLLGLYESDIVYCFDIDHATIAVPYRKLRDCWNLLKGKAVISASEQDKMDSIKSILESLGVDPGLIMGLLL